MPLQRNQPSPDRQSVLSFVSPSVADLLFYETVDAKTVGAGSGLSITAMLTTVAQGKNVAQGFHQAGFYVDITTSAVHGWAIGDIVTTTNIPTGNLTSGGE